MPHVCMFVVQNDGYFHFQNIDYSMLACAPNMYVLQDAQDFAESLQPRLPNMEVVSARLSQCN